MNPLRLLKARPRFFIAAMAVRPDLVRLASRLAEIDAPAGCVGLCNRSLSASRDRDDGAVEDRASPLLRAAALRVEGQILILVLAAITALVSLGGTMSEMAAAKTFKGDNGWRHIALAGVTVLLSWTFAHTIFAIHYAHEYFARPDDALEEGLEFPGHEPPDYWDFVYYSFVIGTATATADVNVTPRPCAGSRPLHCVFAFFFNTTILALR